MVPLVALSGCAIRLDESVSDQMSRFSRVAIDRVSHAGLGGGGLSRLNGNVGLIPGLRNDRYIG